MKKLELRHDVIAQKVWERLPVELRMRRQILQLLELQYQNYLDAGKKEEDLLPEKELLKFRAFFPSSTLDSNLKEFIKKSEALVEQKKKEERLKEAKRQEEELKRLKEKLANRRKIQQLLMGVIVVSLVAIGLLASNIQKDETIEDMQKQRADLAEEIDSLKEIVNSQKTNIERNTATLNSLQQTKEKLEKDLKTQVLNINRTRFQAQLDLVDVQIKSNQWSDALSSLNEASQIVKTTVDSFDVNFDNNRIILNKRREIRQLQSLQVSCEELEYQITQELSSRNFFVAKKQCFAAINQCAGLEIMKRQLQQRLDQIVYEGFNYYKSRYDIFKRMPNASTEKNMALTNAKKIIEEGEVDYSNKTFLNNITYGEELRNLQNN